MTDRSPRRDTPPGADRAGDGGEEAGDGLSTLDLAPGAWWEPVELVAQHVTGRGTTEVIRECPACRGRWTRERVRGLDACPDCAYDGTGPAEEYTP